MFAAKIESVRSNNVSDLAHAGTSVHSVQEREPLSTQPHWADELQFVCPRCRKAIELFSESPLSGCSVCHAKVQRIGDIYSFISECTSTGWQEFFDRRSQLPDGQTSAGNDYRFPIQQHLVIRGFQLLCGDEPNDARILDLGCGNGSFSRALWPDRFLAGVDYSIGMCRLAQSSALRVFHADALALPFANEQFDLIYSAEILQYVGDLSKLGEELVRVCRPGGRIIVSTLDRSSLLRRLARSVRKVLPHPSAPSNAGVIMRTAGEIAAMARGLPLAVGRTCWVHFPIAWLHCAPTTEYRFEFAASNAIVEFTKLSVR